VAAGAGRRGRSRRRRCRPGHRADSTAGWLRGRLRAGATQAGGWVRVARALFRGPLAGTGQALAAGEIAPAHAAVLAAGTQDLPAPTAAQAEPVLLEAARRLDPPRLRRLVAHLREVADPEGAEAQARRRHEQRGLCVSPTFQGMVAIDGLLDPEAGETLLAALEPLARPASAEDERSGPQRSADALTELARRALEGGRLPQAGGVRPQLTVTVELASLLGQPGLPGGEGGWTGSLPVDTCQRLACDAALTRVLVARHRHHPGGHRQAAGSDHPADPDGLAARLRAAVALLPAALGGAPPNRWSWVAPYGSCRPPSASPWRCVTAAAASPAVTGRSPGVTHTTCATGCTAARPTSPTSCCCAAPITVPCTRAAGGCTATPTASSPPPRRTDDDPLRPEPSAAGGPAGSSGDLVGEPATPAGAAGEPGERGGGRGQAADAPGGRLAAGGRLTRRGRRVAAGRLHQADRRRRLHRPEHQLGLDARGQHQQLRRQVDEDQQADHDGELPQHLAGVVDGAADVEGAEVLQQPPPDGAQHRPRAAPGGAAGPGWGAARR
jgi:hypothetical protein